MLFSVMQFITAPCSICSLSSGRGLFLIFSCHCLPFLPKDHYLGSNLETVLQCVTSDMLLGFVALDSLAASAHNFQVVYLSCKITHEVATVAILV